MKLKRPHIPLRIRLEVIARQLQMNGQLFDVMSIEVIPTLRARLDYMLTRMFGNRAVHLDHDPPLCLRAIIDADKGIYQPDANDPRYLIYRTAEDHRLKTFVRGDGAQFSDAALRRRELRKRRVKRPSRWPPGRKLRSRSSW